MKVHGRRWRVRDAVLPFGLLFFAGFVFFSVWGWRSAGPAQAFQSERCAATAPVTAPCRLEGTATATGTFAHYMPASHGATLYGVTYTGHGRVPNATVTYTWGPGRSPLPKKGEQLKVTLWQGMPVYLSFGTTTVTVNTPPDKEPPLVAGFADVAALGAVFAAMIGRPLPWSRKALLALRVVDWIWIPGLAAGFLLVVLHFYAAGFTTIDAAGGLAFVVSQALRVRLVFSFSRGSTSVGDDPKSPPPPGLRAERERRRQQANGAGGSRTRTGGYIDSCPVAPSDQHWIEFELTVLNSRFGIGAHSHPTILPAPDFYPVAYDGEGLEVHELTRKLCGPLGVDIEKVWVRLLEESTVRADAARARNAPYSGHFSKETYDPETDLYIIDLDRWLAGEPPVLTAVIAHELAHLRLHDVRHPEAGTDRFEQQADMLAIACGLGLFGANVSFQTQKKLTGAGALSLGRLDRDMYGYALACYAWLRGEREPQWAKTLGPGPRNRLERGLRYLARAADDGELPSFARARRR
jgi:hypothetical protein